jgi:hypothetical protein
MRLAASIVRIELIGDLFLLGSAPSGFASDKMVGDCYTVRGRLSYYNGTPSTRIWIVGTHRMLGVRSEDSRLPSNVKPLLKGFGDQIFADYVVCPLTPERLGQMRIVWVKSANHVVHRVVPQP